MLGKGASLLRDAEGNFSLRVVRALEACHRAGVEVVIKSGRRKAQVYEDARLIGQPAYIYEMGCGLVDGPEEVFLTGDIEPSAGTFRVRAGRAVGRARSCCWRRSKGGSSTTRPGTRTASSRTCFEGASSWRRSTSCSRSTATRDLRLVDNGITERRSPALDVGTIHTYHLIPRAAGKANAVAAHMRRRGFAPRGVHRHRRLAGGPRGRRRGRAFLPGGERARARSRASRAATCAGNVTVTEEPMSHGFYEAVVRSLAE